MKNVRPILDNIVIQPVFETVSPGGIVLTEEDPKRQIFRGTILAVGEGKWKNGQRVPMGVKVGDVVYFNKFLIMRLEINGDPIFMGKEEAIVAIINENKSA